MNYIAEACAKILKGKDIGFSLKGDPTNEEEWKANYTEQIGKTDDNCAIMSTDPTKWTVTWKQIDDLQASLKVDLPLEQLRIERNYRLTETDWVVAKSTETSTPISDEWKTYLQALRDITKTATSLDDVKWPTKPN